MIKVLLHALPGPEPEELARFTLGLDGRLVAEYQDSLLRTEHERDGIWTLEAGRLTPADGLAFFDALEKAYANSSLMYVETR